MARFKLNHCNFHCVCHLLDISKNTAEDGKPEHRLDDIEQKLYESGVKTNAMFTNWLQMKSNKIRVSELVHEHSKKRKRNQIDFDGGSASPDQPRKR